MHNIRYRRLNRAVQATGDVRIILEHLTRSRTFQNVQKDKEEMRVLFRDFEHEDTRSHIADGFERISMELQKLVQT